jgi:hypothetical protein
LLPSTVRRSQTFPTRGEWSNHERLANAACLIFCKPACEFAGRFLIDATFSLISASPDSSDTESTQRRILQSISSCHDCVAPAPLARPRA